MYMCIGIISRKKKFHSFIHPLFISIILFSEEGELKRTLQSLSLNKMCRILIKHPKVIFYDYDIAMFKKHQLVTDWSYLEFFLVTTVPGGGVIMVWASFWANYLSKPLLVLSHIQLNRQL